MSRSHRRLLREVGAGGAMRKRRRTIAILRQKLADCGPREVSKRYWLTQRLLLLRQRRDYVSAVVVDTLRGNPPPGVLWLKPSTGGTYGRSRGLKEGPPDPLLGLYNGILSNRRMHEWRPLDVGKLPTLAERLQDFKRRKRLDALSAAGVFCRETSNWTIWSSAFPTFHAAGGEVRLTIGTDGRPWRVLAEWCEELPPTPQEALELLCRESEETLRRAAVKAYDLETPRPVPTTVDLKQGRRVVREL